MVGTICSLLVAGGDTAVAMLCSKPLQTETLEAGLQDNTISALCMLLCHYFGDLIVTAIMAAGILSCCAIVSPGASADIHTLELEDFLATGFTTSVTTAATWPNVFFVCLAVQLSNQYLAVAKSALLHCFADIGSQFHMIWATDLYRASGSICGCWFHFGRISHASRQPRALGDVKGEPVWCRAGSQIFQCDPTVHVAQGVIPSDF